MSTKQADAQVGIMTDLTRCIGCGACAMACKQSNKLPGEVAEKLDAYTFTIVEERGGAFVRRQCMHCIEPTCVSVCPVAALYKTDLGAVSYDPSKCMGCRYCILACPFNIPKYQWDKPIPVVGKCTMCYATRLSHGKRPACTSACPTGATIFGERDNLIEEARNRIKRSPKRYVDQIYGDRLAGGTSVLYLSAIPFGRLGFREDVADAPYPRLTYAVIEQIPKIVSLGSVALVGLYWIINRRIEMQRAALTEAEAKDAEVSE